MKKFLPLMFLLVSGLGMLGCEDEVFLCEGGECVDDQECFDECANTCIEGTFNLAALECTLGGNCLCECFVGCR
ncbi:MAG: hypothetical protein AAF436_01060 [Myxococcota bacterium]